MGGGTRNAVRKARLAAGVDQGRLAERIGLSRQALSAIETGAATPSTAVALRIAAALEKPVEQLFWLEPRSATAKVSLAQAPLPKAGRPRRVRRLALGEVGGRRVGHALAEEDFAQADGLLSPRGGQVRLLRAPEDVDQNVLVSGCDPALALLAARLGDRH
ncbi:MAG TPA: helix-turn-helix transcriptional regulator, partial [Myxococcales bacterium]|nr:helix-turn-helix transcriptional regulator [Myxococcales bacterium]